MAITTTITTINDLPDVILSIIFSSISDTRTRNSLSLVNRKFLTLERATRTSLTLRGNARDLYMIPNCYRSVTHLDLSLLSPWGHSLLASSPPSDPSLLAHRLGLAFPLVSSLTVYVRSPVTLKILLRQWPGLRHLKLIRWHPRCSFSPLGEDIEPLFEHCEALTSVDLSNFYYWTEDIPPVVETYPGVSMSLTCLNLLTLSLTDGFKSHEIRIITAACPNLSRFLIACLFDPNYNGFFDEQTLLAIPANCPNLTLLHLVDTTSLGATRGDPDHEGYSAQDAMISRVALVDFFSGLPLLEDLDLDVCNNVRDSGLALEALKSKCPKLKALKLGHFHGICMAIGSQLDGIALCSGLESLSIKKSADLTDMGLIEIGRGCCKLAKFEVDGCKRITMNGMRTMACLLRQTLVEVKISCCKNLDAVASLRALEPIRDRIQRLHIDCVWNGLEEGSSRHEEDPFGICSFNLDEDPFGIAEASDDDDEYARKKKKCKHSLHTDSYSSYSSSSSYTASNGNGFQSKAWNRLQYLSLWIAVGELVSWLPNAGLDDCPNLQEIRIKVEGDCRNRHKPSQPAFGLSCLGCYPQLSKMQLDCSDTIGYALTAPSGQMDLSLWERFFLNEIGYLTLLELDYWPPQDRDVNQRSLSLPGAGLLAECLTLRKLFIHGTAHEHFMMFLLKIPNLRDVQLREDYYPAPENDMITEMRVDSCSRFEDALNSRLVFD